jgi:hypothetical protein
VSDETTTAVTAKDGLTAAGYGTACAACGAVLKPEAKFCTTCGAATPPPKPTCPACGKELRADARFCTSCGATIGKAAAVPAAPAAAGAPAALGTSVASAPASMAPTQTPGPSQAATPDKPPLVAKAINMLGVGGLLMIAAGILGIVSVAKPWFTMPDLGELAFNEGWAWSTGFEVYEPSPIQADIGYFAATLGAAAVVIGLLSIFNAAPALDNALDRAWNKAFGNHFADGGMCLLVLAAVILRFVTRQEGTEYASGIYLFLVAAIMLTVGSVMAKAQMKARAHAALAAQVEN